MKHLRKITLSNIRRFGEDVVIDIADGATIFLAPNGTGKTAVFEAVELALTGNVKRLQDSTDPLIRDLQDQALVRIDFEDGKYCQAEIKKGQQPALSGHHEELFGNTETQDLPFLLQLTHFLNQQGKNWFVTSHGTEAGSQLEHLSIGREATEVNQLIPGAKRAATSELQQAQREFDDISKIWEEWRALLAKRNGNISPFNNLLEKSVLLLQMNTIALNLPSFPAQNEEQLISLKIMNGELKTAINSLIAGLKSRVIELNALFPIPKEIEQYTLNLDAARKNKKSIEVAITDLLEKIKQAEEGLRLQRQEKDQQSRAVAELKMTKGKINDLQLLNKQIEALQKTAEQKANEVEETTNAHAKIKSELDKAEMLAATFRALDLRIKTLSEDEANLKKLNLEFEALKTLFNDQQELEGKTIPSQQTTFDELRISLGIAKTDEEKCRQDLIKAEDGLDALTAANDVVKQALSTILSNYPQDRADCPVCGEVYTPTELQSRMRSVADRTDPAIKTLADLVSQTSVRQNELTTKRNLLESQTEIAERTINESKERLTKITDQIDTKLASFFADCRTLNEVGNRIRLMTSRLAEQSSKLQLDINAAGARPAPDSVITLSSRLVEINESLLKLLDEMQKISVSVSDSVTARKEISDMLEEALTPEEINRLLLVEENVIEQKELALISIQNELTTFNEELKAQRDKLLNEDLNISSISTRISDLRSQWANTRLLGEVAIESLETAIDQVSERLKTADDYINQLEVIERELSKWQIVDDEIKTQQEIQLVINDSTEEQHQEKLELQLTNAKNKLDWISGNVEILNEFASRLKGELEVVYERLRSVNPLWQSLLCRIIIDPRFSSTSLESYGYYKKSHANVNVKLHDKDTLVSQVASEAQITDLQLTFLLAMAHKYQWTKWNTLLLDDPTQHHDLVHASAVFDLLRDYIADYDFQILMATHDPVQAKFFMRKLENDGIPVNIVTFSNTENGVFAKSLS